MTPWYLVHISSFGLSSIYVQVYFAEVEVTNWSSNLEFGLLVQASLTLTLGTSTSSEDSPVLPMLWMSACLASFAFSASFIACWHFSLLLGGNLAHSTVPLWVLTKWCFNLVIPPMMWLCDDHKIYSSNIVIVLLPWTKNNLYKNRVVFWSCPACLALRIESFYWFSRE